MATRTNDAGVPVVWFHRSAFDPDAGGNKRYSGTVRSNGAVRVDDNCFGRFHWIVASPTSFRNSVSKREVTRGLRRWVMRELLVLAFTSELSTQHEPFGLASVKSLG